MQFVIARSLPGRLRVRMEAEEYWRYGPTAITRVLSDMDGIKSVTVNPCTGSVLILYSSLLSADVYTEALTAFDIFVLPEQQPQWQILWAGMAHSHCQICACAGRIRIVFRR